MYNPTTKRYRIVKAEHTCCFESRVEVTTKENPEPLEWEVVGEFCNQKDAEFFAEKMGMKDAVKSYIESSTLFS